MKVIASLLIATAVHVAVLLTTSSVLHPIVRSTAASVPGTISQADTDTVLLTEDLLRRYLAVLQALQPFWGTHEVLWSESSADTLSQTVTVTGADGAPGQKTYTSRDYAKLVHRNAELAAIFTGHNVPAPQFLSIKSTVYQALYAIAAHEIAIQAHTTAVSRDTSRLITQNILAVRTMQSALYAGGVKIRIPWQAGTHVPQLIARQWLHTSAETPPATFGDGHIYVLDATAPWCGDACEAVYPELVKLHETYGKHGVRVVYLTGLFGKYGQAEGLSPAAEIDSLVTYAITHHFVGPVAVFDDIMDSGAGEGGGLSSEYPEVGWSIDYPELVIIDGNGVLHTGRTAEVTDGNGRHTSLAPPGGHARQSSEGSLKAVTNGLNFIHQRRDLPHVSLSQVFSVATTVTANSWYREPSLG